MPKLRWKVELVMQAIEEERFCSRRVSMVYALVRFQPAPFSALGDE